MTGSASEPRRVLIAGGGVAGLETCLALRDLAGDRVRCSLLSPEEDFVFGPPIEAPHSPGERVSVPTVARFWRLLTGVVDELSAA